MPAGGRMATLWVHYTTSCNTQSSVLEYGQNNCPKHVELTRIINEPLLLHLVGCLYYLYRWCTVKQMLHLVGCLYYLYRWCTVKQITDNEIYLLIKYIKSVIWRVAKRLSYIEDARCLKFKGKTKERWGLKAVGAGVKPKWIMENYRRHSTLQKTARRPVRLFIYPHRLKLRNVGQNTGNFSIKFFNRQTC